MTVDSSPGALNIEHYYMTFELCDNISPIFQSQVVILSSPGGGGGGGGGGIMRVDFSRSTQHLTMTNPW